MAFYLTLKEKPKLLYYNHYKAISSQYLLVCSCVKKKLIPIFTHSLSLLTFISKAFNMTLQLSKASSEGFHREITCNTRAVNAEWLSTASFSHYCLISWEQFSKAEEQLKKEAVSLCGWLWGCNLWLSDGLPWHKSHIRPRGYLVHCEIHNPLLPLGHNHMMARLLCR